MNALAKEIRSAQSGLDDPAFNAAVQKVLVRAMLEARVIDSEDDSTVRGARAQETAYPLAWAYQQGDVLTDESTSATTQAALKLSSCIADGDLEAARAAKDRADAAMDDHRTATARARAEAQAQVAAAVTRAQDELLTKTDAMNAKLAQQIEAAEAQIAAARDAAMGALRLVSADTAAAVVARIAGGADRGLVDAAVDRELAARGYA
jgi:F0F1-type ATP synthase membrane subunit b/b'